MEIRTLNYVLNYFSLNLCQIFLYKKVTSWKSVYGTFQLLSLGREGVYKMSRQQLIFLYNLFFFVY